MEEDNAGGEGLDWAVETEVKIIQDGREISAILLTVVEDGLKDQHIYIYIHTQYGV